MFLFLKKFCSMKYVLLVKLSVSQNKKGNCFKFFLKEELFEIQRVRGLWIFERVS